MPSNISAANSRRISTTWNRTVIEEISLIDVYIAASAADMNTSVSVGSTTQVTVNNTSVTGTGMTNDNSTGRRYYQVWQNLTEDPSREAEMAAVITHFTDLGYSISRRANSAGTVFSWYLTWF